MPTIRCGDGAANEAVELLVVGFRQLGVPLMHSAAVTFGDDAALGISNAYCLILTQLPQTEAEK
jgi:hypothetical protein